MVVRLEAAPLSVT